ncbi:MAG: hypothetical protein IK093_12620 [Ruminiclostridium sp.]|nr:hypothetical protein [Ruminiclostridium sp.]
MQIRQKLYGFLSGRYGNDRLNSTIMVLCLVLMIANMFIGSYAFSVITLLLMAWVIFRTLSRDLYARQKENRVFLDLIGKIRGWINLNIRRFRDRKTHVYRTCPGCKKTLRLPKVKGDHTVCCPCCKHDFSCKI